MPIWHTAHGARRHAEAPRGQHLCVRVHAYIQYNVCWCVRKCIHVCLFVKLYLHKRTQLHVRVCLVCACLCFSVSRCISTYVFAHGHLCVSVYLGIHTCTHIYTRQKAHVSYLQDSRKANRKLPFIIILMKVIVSIPKKKCIETDSLGTNRTIKDKQIHAVHCDSQ